MNNEIEIVETALTHLPAAPGRFQYTPLPAQHTFDGTLLLSMPDGRETSFCTEVITQPRSAWLEQWRKRIDSVGARHAGLLICLYLSPALQQYCINNALNFIDGAGNAFISAPGLYVHISGKKSERRVEQSGSLSIGIMKLLFVLLSDEKAINYTYREIAELAGISLGMVSKGFDYLASKKLYRESNDGRRFTRINELCWLWVQEYPIVLRPKLKTLRLTGELSWQNASLLEGECWAGEVAGHKLSGGYLHPEKFEIFTSHSFTERWKALGLRPSPAGNWLLIQRFWGEAFTIDERAWALLTVAELLALNDDRNIETARRINAQYLHIAKPSF